MKQRRVIAIDLAKTVFQVCLFDHRMQVQSNRAMNRAKLQALLVRQAPARVVMEACGSAHFWGRWAQAQGHEVVLVPPKQVAPYRQGQKTDGNDALAIGIAAQQPQLKTVAVKTLEQQALQTLKRVQEHLADQLTATGNALRGLLAEFGLVVAKGPASLKRRLPAILEDAENALPMAARHSLALLWESWQQLAAQRTAAEQQLQAYSATLEPCRRLQAIEGIGYKNAVGLYLRLGDGQAFKNGREAAACVGVTPRQHSSGGKVRMGGIGHRRGDQRLRASLITGCHAAVRALRRRPPRNRTEQWLQALIERRGPGRAAVALANRNIRTAWAMLRHATDYQPHTIAA